MRLVLLPEVREDLKEIITHYKRVASTSVAEDFRAEFRRLAREAVERPGSFAVRRYDLRRVNFHRFPYHLLFYIDGETVVVLVLKHNQRHPDFGLDRL